MLNTLSPLGLNKDFDLVPIIMVINVIIIIMYLEYQCPEVHTVHGGVSIYSY